MWFGTRRNKWWMEDQGMKKLLTILCLLLLPILFGGSKPCQLFESYIGSTKEVIITDLKTKNEHYLISDKMNVRIDSLNHWSVNQKYYTYIFYFDDDSRMTSSFSVQTNLCTNYLFDFTSTNYKESSELLDESLTKIDSLVWYEKENKAVVMILKNGYRDDGYSMYVYKK